MLFNIVSILLCILSPNPIVSLLFLILTFINFSFFLMLAGMEFLSLLVLLIYVGAICILFIFVLMILDIKILIIKKYSYLKILSTFLLSFIIFILFLFKMGINLNIYYNNTNIYTIWFENIFDLSDMEVFGFVLFTYYLPHFIILSFILFIVLIGSIAIVKDKKIVFYNRDKEILLDNYLKFSEFLKYNV